ncbi:hypothetical protein R70723_12465 [Paenibacillus sp. FSL R7-0273]|uniref:hypothetical protein n=1 Tax=Paenibacillus sp. FSL R7-0273 TaxID=1536772 RepID=UPI0004F84609|nr:hypothetical protein [Paenibacillus sp. FSL R7-0273]AIQ46596.1 hypothetical protein R70723_12465 [Paenibacillus sp. FSL R7-0273]OMF97635.1 hypothetical protein BK144_03105 [Paenibacillus sp. FSL R7-0273]
MAAVAVQQTAGLFSGLLERMENIDFVKQFADNPDAALREAGLGISLADFTKQLSENPQLFEAVVGKLSNNVEFINKSNIAMSSCDQPR